MATFKVVAEPVRFRFEDSKSLQIRLLLRRIRPSWLEGNRYSMSGVLRRLLDPSTAAQNDQVSKGNPFPARPGDRICDIAQPEESGELE